MDGYITTAGGTIKWKVEQRRTEFANNLLSCQCQHLGANIQYFPLTHTMRTYEKSAQLILRQSVKLLWEGVLEDIISLSHGEQKKKKTISIVTGNPGIGLTRSMDYLLRLLLLRNELVFYEEREIGVVRAFVPPHLHNSDNNYLVFCTTNFDARETCLNEDSTKPTPYYLYNPDHNPSRNAIPSGYLQHHLVIATAPVPHNIKATARYASAITKRYFMPSWKLDELLVVGPSLFELDQREIISKFCIFGGVLRPMVGSPHMIDSCLNELTSGSYRLPKNTMKNILDNNMVVIASGSEDGHIDSGLFMIEPDQTAIQSSPAAVVTFASPFACALIAVEFWNVIDDVHNPFLMEWLKLVCILVISKGGKFEVRQLFPSNLKQAADIDENNIEKDDGYEEEEENKFVRLAPSSLLFSVPPSPRDFTSDGLHDYAARVSASESEHDNGPKTDGENSSLIFYRRWVSDALIDCHDATTNSLKKCTLISAPPKATFTSSDDDIPIPSLVDYVSLPHHPDIGPIGYKVVFSSECPISYDECETILEALPASIHLNLYFITSTHIADHFKHQSFVSRGGGGGASCDEKHKQLESRVNQYVIGLSHYDLMKFLDGFRENGLSNDNDNRRLAEFIENTMKASLKNMQAFRFVSRDFSNASQ
jgi:hypothetical protein